MNEQYLFYGSGRTEPQTIATSSDGFMVEHGRDDAFYGKGCYFALQARYSHHYAHKLHPLGGDCHRQLLLVNVLCGSSKEYTNSTIDRNMNGITLPSEYDSVRGGPHKPRHSGPGKDDSEMVVVYKSSQTRCRSS